MGADIGEILLPKLESLSDIGVIVSDRKKAKAFYTKTLGLKIRNEMKDFGYLALGPTLKGADASLTPFQPDPVWGQEMYERAMKDIGIVTGIGFRTGNLDKTIASLKRKKVKAEKTEGEEMENFGRFEDPDGNVFFVFEPEKVSRRVAGLLSLDFVTVASRDAKKSGEFLKKSLGLKGKVSAEGFGEYRVTPKGTAISPFTPNKEMYDDPKSYEEDLAHIGERTSIGFITDDVYKLQEQLMAKGVRFSQKAQKESWGGIQARFLDVDDNEYAVVQMDE
jgi:catechol 2,3-dioxygenase-like lactoylglutathione lyase family enzyme